jgi:hypothetical protein
VSSLAGGKAGMVTGGLLANESSTCCVRANSAVE